MPWEYLQSVSITSVSPDQQSRECTDGPYETRQNQWIAVATGGVHCRPRW